MLGLEFFSVSVLLVSSLTVVSSIFSEREMLVPCVCVKFSREAGGVSFISWKGFFPVMVCNI